MYRQRSDFEGDFEVRKQNRKRKGGRETIGVHRPVSVDTTLVLRETFKGLDELVACETSFSASQKRKMTRANPATGEAIIVPVAQREHHGLVLVQKSRVAKRLTPAFAYKGGFQTHRAVENIHRMSGRSADMPLQLPIAKIGWRGAGERDLALLFDKEAAEVILLEHETCIRELGKLGLKNIDPENGFTPNIVLGTATAHLTFEQQRQVAEYVESTLPTTVTLEPMVIDVDQYSSKDE
jgi:hypothetical protein